MFRHVPKLAVGALAAPLLEQVFPETMSKSSLIRTRRIGPARAGLYVSRNVKQDFQRQRLRKHPHRFARL
jgi:hypothetical protein